MSRLVLVLLVAVAACAQPSRPRFPVPIPDRTIGATPPAPRAVSVPAPPKRAPWQPAKVVADAATIADQRVVVAAGDTLSRIGERTGSSVQAIAEANGIAPPYVISPGQVLKIPGGHYHTVKPGETGIAIARAYGADWERVIETNALKAPYTIRVGQRLRLPTPAVAVREMTLAERAAAFSIDIDDLIAGSASTVAATETATPAGSSEHANAAQPAPTEDASAQPAAANRPLPPPPPFNGRFTSPVDGRVVSRFGTKPDGRRNDGINIRATAGTPIRAAADGVVVYAGDGIEGFGNLVLVKHADGWVTAYAHAQDFLVIRGDTVRQGDPIARVGKSGSVEEPQLHFEIRQGRRPVDPLTQVRGIG